MQAYVVVGCLDGNGEKGTHNPYQTAQVINFYGFCSHLLFTYCI